MVRILPYRTVENVIDGVVITFTDLTAGLAMERALHEQAEQARQMAEALPILVWGCRPDGAADYLNKRWVEYTGISESEQIGYGWMEQVHPEDREQIRNAWRAAVRAGSSFDEQMRIRNAAGAYRWFKCRSVPIRDSKGAVVKWYGTNTDVDDLKRATSPARQK
jgi:two-component system CheB/CheR fusion protein